MNDWLQAERDYEDEVIGHTSIPRLFADSAARYANRTAQVYKGGIYDRTLTPTIVPDVPAGEWGKLSYSEMHDIVKRLAAGFRELGVDPGDRVGIFADTRMEWAQADLGLLAAGGVVTTVYSGSSPNQVEYLLGDAGASGVVLENGNLLERVLAVEDDLDLEFIVAMDDLEADREDIYSLAEVHDLGAEAFDPEAYEQWLDARDLDDLASLIYTSGTTGRPKGVQLTHWNFRSNINQVRKRFGPRPDRGPDTPAIDADARAVSFLPLAHVFERLSGHFFMFASGATVAYAESPDTLAEDFEAIQPTTGTSVPRVYERIYKAIREQAGESAIRERIFEWAMDVGRRAWEADDPGPLLSMQLGIADRLVFQRVRDGLGGNIEMLISGGGSLSPDLCALYHVMGLPIYEGYGLTETSPVVTANPPEAPKVGTIGPPVVDMELRLDDEVGQEIAAEDEEVGELLLKGPNVTAGYWNKPGATERSFTEDGWFRTGDIVERDEDGYLIFRERAKELLVLSTGKNVAPGPIEDAFAPSDVVEQIVVIGDGEKFVSALVVPEFEGLREWGDREGIDLPVAREDVIEDDRAIERLQREIDEVNERFESHETIKQFRLIAEPFTEDNNLLTPSMKKRRPNILERYEDLIAEIYEED